MNQNGQQPPVINDTTAVAKPPPIAPTPVTIDPLQALAQSNVPTPQVVQEPVQPTADSKTFDIDSQGAPEQPDTDPVQPQSNEQEKVSFVDNVGGSFIDLLNDIISHDGFMTQVANEMNISVMQCTAIATAIQDKITQQNLTKEEIAFILSSTVIEEPLDSLGV